MSPTTQGFRAYTYVYLKAYSISPSVELSNNSVLKYDSYVTHFDANIFMISDLIWTKRFASNYKSYK